MTIKILSETETNTFANPSKSLNGGGYAQPLVEFELNGKRGIFEDTSCGDFGSRFDIEFDGKMATWGTMLSESEVFSDFTGNEGFFAELAKEFDVPTEKEL